MNHLHENAFSSVGADRRAATNLTREFAATERGDHLQTRNFMEVPDDHFKLTTADENDIQPTQWEGE